MKQASPTITRKFLWPMPTIGLTNARRNRATILCEYTRGNRFKASNSDCSTICQTANTNNNTYKSPNPPPQGRAPSPCLADLAAPQLTWTYLTFRLDSLGLTPSHFD